MEISILIIIFAIIVTVVGILLGISLTVCSILMVIAVIWVNVGKRVANKVFSEKEWSKCSFLEKVIALIVWPYLLFFPLRLL